MQSVLYSCIGTTDPVRGMRDGGLMHILRFYRPEAVYLFLSQEMIRRDREDDRIAKTFAFLREKWDGYNPRLVRFETGIQDPSDMDALTAPMDALMQRVLEENPGTEILLNLSSGTPQMQILLAQMALCGVGHKRTVTGLVKGEYPAFFALLPGRLCSRLALSVG